jgi:hypothetical protein
MAKTPRNPEEIFPELTADYRGLFGEDLLSIILYGSGAGQDYVPGKSDLNLLIVLSDRGLEEIDRALETVGRWRRRNVAIPLFMTRGFLAGALDAYPVEFLNMKRSYRVVTGQDVLAPLDFDPGSIRLQIERELRGKILHLHSGYLATEGKASRIRELIAQSLTAFVSLFGAILCLKGLPMPAAKRDIITAGGSAMGIEVPVFLQCDEIRSKTDHLSPAEVKTVFRAYLREVGRLCERIDRLTL